MRHGQVASPGRRAEQFERDEGAARRGDEGRRVRPVDACSRCRPARWPRPTTSSSCARSCTKHGGIYSSHIRNEGTGVFDAVKEAIAIGERAGVPVDIIHLKIADQKLWGRMNEVVALIEAARKRGVNVQANVYPYTRGNNNLASIIPPWAHEGGTGQDARAAQGPEAARADEEGHHGGHPRLVQPLHRRRRRLVAGCSSAARATYEGLTMDRVIAARAKGKTPTPDPLDVLFDLLIEEGGSVPTVYAHHTEKDMNLALVQPWCSIGSDGSALRDRGPAAARQPAPAQLRHLPARARRLRPRAAAAAAGRRGAQDDLAERGQARHPRPRLLRPGNFADVTLFDPATVIDRATYTHPSTTGGDRVRDRQRPGGARPGQTRARCRGKRSGGSRRCFGTPPEPVSRQRSHRESLNQNGEDDDHVGHGDEDIACAERLAVEPREAVRARGPPRCRREVLPRSGRGRCSAASARRLEEHHRSGHRNQPGEEHHGDRGHPHEQVLPGCVQGQHFQADQYE